MISPAAYSLTVHLIVLAIIGGGIVAAVRDAFRDGRKGRHRRR